VRWVSNERRTCVGRARRRYRHDGAGLEGGEAALFRLAVGIAAVPQTHRVVRTHRQKAPRSLRVHGQIDHSALVPCVGSAARVVSRTAVIAFGGDHVKGGTLQDADDSAASNANDVDERVVATDRQVGVGVLTLIVRVQVAQPRACV
jgi:hypothetical protein